MFSGKYPENSNAIHNVNKNFWIVHGIKVCSESPSGSSSLRVGPYKDNDDSCPDNLPHNPISVLERTQSPNMPPQCHAVLLDPHRHWPGKVQLLVVAKRKEKKILPQPALHAVIRAQNLCSSYLLAANELSTDCCKSKHAMVGQRLRLSE